MAEIKEKQMLIELSTKTSHSKNGLRTLKTQ